MPNKQGSGRCVEAHVDAAADEGPLEQWRHALGLGGVNSLPLPDRVVDGVRKLEPQLIRIFIQEFFQVYRGEGRFDWARLDAYMDSLARTGAKVVAAITIKPRALYPAVDQSAWRPLDVREWQHVISEMVRRYSVREPIVTHWEIGNETDIGESGGCPYLIADPDEYGEYYSMTIEPVLRTFPQAKVGGPAIADVRHALLPGFVRYCARTGAQLDFATWHRYDRSPAAHAACVEVARAALDGYPGRRPELMVTEWSGGFSAGATSDEEALAPRRAAVVAASIVEMMKVRPDWTFYYHLCDQTCYPGDFEPFFSAQGVANMARHWNEIPHKFGLFSLSGEVRPQYFVYRMLARLGSRRVSARSDDGIRIVAGSGDGCTSALLVNYSPDGTDDVEVACRFSGLAPGPKSLTAYCIAGERRWDGRALELLPVEEREGAGASDLDWRVRLPADGTMLLTVGARGR